MKNINLSKDKEPEQEPKQERDWLSTILNEAGEIVVLLMIVFAVSVACHFISGSDSYNKDNNTPSLSEHSAKEIASVENKEIIHKQSDNTISKEYLEEAKEIFASVGSDSDKVEFLRNQPASMKTPNGVFISSDFKIVDGLLYLCASKKTWCNNQQPGKIITHSDPSLLVPISDAYFRWYYGKKQVKYLNFEIVNKQEWDFVGDRMTNQTKFIIVKLAFYGDD